MMQSVPVLILVLCCMASAHRAIHNMAIRHLEARQGCSLPDDYPDMCVQALGDLNTNNIILIYYLLHSMLLVAIVVLGHWMTTPNVFQGMNAMLNIYVRDRMASTALSYLLTYLIPVIVMVAFLKHALILVARV